MKKIQEGSAVIEVPTETKISKKLEVFYNPAMKLNRDLSVLLLNAVDNKQMRMADILAGTGIRTIRFKKELKKGKIKEILANDYNSSSKIKKNLKLNKVKAEVFSQDANKFLLNQQGFDYIDVDPFGSPNDFLDSAIKRIARNGILAVTATDTSALCGTYPKAGMRKYWAKTYLNGFMHESALRILIRKVQLVGFQFAKALVPVFSYADQHYVRIFFKYLRGKEECNKLAKQHKYILYNPKTVEYEVSSENSKKGYETIGPMYTGSINDKKLIKKMMKDADKDTKKLLNLIYNELDIVGSYDIHKLCKKLKKTVPSFSKIKGTKVHYDQKSMKTKLTYKELVKILK